MKKNTTHVHWWGLGTRGTESKIRLVGDRSTTECKTVQVKRVLGRFLLFKSSLLTVNFSAVSSKGVCALVIMSRINMYSACFLSH